MRDQRDGRGWRAYRHDFASGSAANVQVVAAAAGYLNAWIDFNTNGAWSDAGEQVFTNVALTAARTRWR